MNRILLVFGVGGPPTDYLLPRVRAFGDVFAYVVTDPNPYQRSLLENGCAEVVYAEPGDYVGGEAVLRESVARAARRVGASAVVTFDEFSVVPVAQAAIHLGLRGAGPNVRLSRDKWLMRGAFRAAGVASPAFGLVTDRESLLRACDVLGFPFLIKVTVGAGSISHTIIDSREAAVAAWEAASVAVRQFADGSKLRYVEDFRAPAFVAESILHGTTEGWYDVEGYGDYLSVEGVVCDGRYFPVGITSRLPTVHPFTEVGNQTPCVLRPEQQHRVAEFARKAVDALGLQFCGTHTEIKLMADGRLGAIETAARLPGALNVPQMETVFGVDMVGLVMETLLEGGSSRLPPSMLVEGGRGASGTLALLSVDEAGVPWPSTPPFSPRVDWSALVSPGTRVTVDWTHTIDEGETVPAYDPLLGMLNFWGVLALDAESPAALVRDQYAIRRGLRGALEAASHAAAAPSRAGSMTSPAAAAPAQAAG